MPSENTPNFSVSGEFFFKQYEIMIASAEKVTDRRQATNAFFVTLLTLFFTVAMAILGKMGSGAEDYIAKNLWAQITVTVGAFSGIGLAEAWKAQIRSYRLLNTAKFSVILDMEKSLPVTIFANEWSALNQAQYKELTAVEARLPNLVQSLLVIICASLATHIYGSSGFIVTAFLFLLAWTIARYGRRFGNFYRDLIKGTKAFYAHVINFKFGKSQNEPAQPTSAQTETDL